MLNSAEIVKLYENGVDTLKISALDGRSRSQIYRVLKGGTNVKDKRVTNDEEVTKIIDLYTSGHTSREVAAAVGMIDSSVRRILKREGVARTPLDIIGLTKDDRDAIVNLYLSGISAERVGEMFNVSQRVVYGELRRRGVASRSYSEANALSVTNKRKRGVRGCIKVGEDSIIFDSFYELCFIIGVLKKDTNTKIKRCKLAVPYSHNGKTRHYNPDFEVCTGGKTKVVEIKSNHKRYDEETILKMEALKSGGFDGVLITESELTLPAKSVFNEFSIIFFKGENLDKYINKYKKTFGNV